MNKAEMEQLNEQLSDLLPVLLDRLEHDSGAELEAWLRVGRSSAVVVCAREEAARAPFINGDDLQDSASELYYLDIEGYDGFHPGKPLSVEGVERIRRIVRAAVRREVLENGLRALIQEITTGYYDDRPDDKSDAVFFVWAAMIEDGLRQQVADLWVLRHSAERHDYMFLMDEGSSLNQVWRLCSDVLPAEVVPVLDLNYLELEETDSKKKRGGVMNDWIQKAALELKEREHRKQVALEYALLRDRLIQTQAPRLFSLLVTELTNAAMVITELGVDIKSSTICSLKYQDRNVTLRLNVPATWVEISGTDLKSYLVTFEVKDSFVAFDLDGHTVGAQRLAEQAVTQLCGLRRSF